MYSCRSDRYQDSSAYAGESVDSDRATQHTIGSVHNCGYVKLYINRKNWLFAGSPRGAEASAFIYSLIETAKANGLEPKRYLMELFERYPLAVNDEQRRELLPWNFKFSG